MVNYTKQERRLSLITDIAIFLLLSFSAFLLLNIFKEIFLSYSLESDNLVEVSNSCDLIEVENVQYVNKIKEEFGMIVKYGESQKDVAKSVNANIQTSSPIINNNLKLIYSALCKYDKKMFKNFEKEGLKISIIIFDSFNNDNLALASKNKLNQFTIYISNTVRLDRAFHHEMCHVLEYYMSNKNVDFEYWNYLNPDNFVYSNSTDGIDSKYIYYLSNYSEENLDTTYFVTKYSKVNEKEDRAEIFAEIMSSTMSLQYIDDKTPIYYKAKYLFKTINNNILYANFEEL